MNLSFVSPFCFLGLLAFTGLAPAEVASKASSTNESTATVSPHFSPSLVEAKRLLKVAAEPLRNSADFEVRFEAQVYAPEAESPERYPGVLLVKDSLRFRLEIPSGTWVSNGQTFWEYHPKTRQVILRSAQDIQGRSVPGKILIQVLDATPLGLDTLTDQGRKAFRIRLQPDANSRHLDSLWVLIDARKTTLRQVVTLDKAGTRSEYRMKTLKARSDLSEKSFDFEAPSQTEVVDMRD